MSFRNTELSMTNTNLYESGILRLSDAEPLMVARKKELLTLQMNHRSTTEWHDY